MMDNIGVSFGIYNTPYQRKIREINSRGFESDGDFDIEGFESEGFDTEDDFDISDITDEEIDSLIDECSNCCCHCNDVDIDIFDLDEADSDGSELEFKSLEISDLTVSEAIKMLSTLDGNRKCSLNFSVHI